MNTRHHRNLVAGDDSVEVGPAPENDAAISPTRIGWRGRSAAPRLTGTPIAGVPAVPDRARARR
jgi:hypothetical protein